MTLCIINPTKFCGISYNVSANCFNLRSYGTIDLCNWYVLKHICSLLEQGSLVEVIRPHSQFAELRRLNFTPGHNYFKGPGINNTMVYKVEKQPLVALSAFHVDLIKGKKHHTNSRIITFHLHDAHQKYWVYILSSDICLSSSLSNEMSPSISSQIAVTN